MEQNLRFYQADVFNNSAYYEIPQFYSVILKKCEYTAQYGICLFYVLSFDAIARTLNVRAALLPFRAHKMQFVEGYDVTAPAY